MTDDDIIGETYQIGTTTLSVDNDGTMYLNGHRLRADAPPLDDGGINWWEPRDTLAARVETVYGPFIEEPSSIPVGMRRLYLVM